MYNCDFEAINYILNKKMEKKIRKKNKKERKKLLNMGHSFVQSSSM